MKKYAMLLSAITLFAACSSKNGDNSVDKGGAAPGTAVKSPDRGRMPASLAGDLNRDFFGTLKRMSHQELDRLYYNGTMPERLPLGTFDGIALIYNAQRAEADNWFRAVVRSISNVFDPLHALTGIAWQGKVFEEGDGNDQTRGLNNRLLFVGQAIHAKVYPGKMLEVLDERFGVKRRFPGSFQEGSGMLAGDGLNLGMDPVFVDGGDSIIIDYRDAGPRSARGIVDEIRYIEEGGEDHYLGRATIGGKFGLFFALKPAGAHHGLN